MSYPFAPFKLTKHTLDSITSLISFAIGCGNRYLTDAAQTTIAGGEYWIDGAINARQPLSSGASIDISALQPGLHKVLVRVKDNLGIWSNIVKETFTVIASGIHSIPADMKTGQWFDLSGKKLNGAPSRPGIYIRDGRKVLIK